MPKIKYPYEFNPKLRRLSKRYSRIKLINGIANGIILPIVFVYVLLVSGLSVTIAGWSSFIPVYSFIIITLMTVVQFPIRLYSGFFLERRYGLSSRSFSSWLTDYAKGLLILYVFTIPAVTGLYYLLPMDSWWIYAGAAYFLITVFLSYIYPVLVFPFFYKTTAYKDVAMRKKLVAMAAKFGKKISTVLVAKESEKSRRANAMFAGIGSTKRIVLFDTLLNAFTKDEIETVIGHELGHYVNKDTIRFIIIDAIKIFPTFWIIDYVLRISVGSFGITAISDVTSLPLFMLVYFLIGIIEMPLDNAYSRRRETAADLFGLNVSKKPKAQISTEKRLADMALGDDNPHPLVEFFFFSHPSAKKRIKMAEDWKKA
jgi:STE24 endopeptidase